MSRRYSPNKAALFLLVAVLAASCQSDESRLSTWCDQLNELAAEGQSVADETYSDMDALRATVEVEEAEHFVAFVENVNSGSGFLSPAGEAATDRLLVVSAELSASLQSPDSFEVPEFSASARLDFELLSREVSELCS